jgi:hypothetical protein
LEIKRKEKRETRDERRETGDEKISTESINRKQKPGQYRLATVHSVSTPSDKSK